jgi:hypothetical protein
MTSSLSFWLALAAAVLSAGESGALLAGMREGEKPSQWMTGANVAYAVSDIGLGLVVGAAELGGMGGSWYSMAALGALTLSCGTRAVEYALGAPQAFCANGPLFAVDLAKLLLSGGAFAAQLTERRGP